MLLSFFDADHGDGSGRPLRDQVEDHLRAAGLATDGGAIRLFCMPRVFGFGFNPLSVYFCYQRDGSLAAILYEVHNTFRERHSYLIPVERDAGAAGVAGAPGAVIDQHCRKGFYVSPFMDMEMSYTFRVAVPDQRVMIAIRAADQDGLLLAAALTGERSALTDLALLRALGDPSAAHLEGDRRDSLACAAAVAQRTEAAAAALAACRAGHRREYRRLAAVTPAGPSLEPRDAKMSARRGVLSRIIDRAIPAMPAGRLQLTLPNGDIIERHGNIPGPDAAMTVHRWRGLRRMLLDGDHGFADGYLDGDWSTPELGQVLEFCMQNESALTATATVGRLGLMRNRIVHWLRHNTRRGSRRNIAAHYDLGNDFFRPWLDAGMNYSSALFANCDTLERAQEAKLDRAAALLELDGGERVLEIGCGWGAFAERVIRHYGASVFGITLSTEQLAYAQTRLAGEVERGRADLRLLDYRDVPGTFDRIASIEMIEAVGERYWPNYFGKIRDCLASGGVALLQAITIDEHRFATYRKCPDFIQRYIFPGGVLPTVSIIEREAARAGLKLVHHEAFGDSYVRTLREWRSRFLRAWPKLEPLGFNDRFRRMWEYYLAYCEVGFRTGSINVGFFKLSG